MIQDRIKNFLTQTKRDHEFSHTILHNHVTNWFIKESRNFDQPACLNQAAKRFLKIKAQVKTIRRIFKAKNIAEKKSRTDQRLTRRTPEDNVKRTHRTIKAT